MSEPEKILVNDCKKDVDYYRPLLNLMQCEIEDEKICENLKVACDYLEKLSEILSAISQIAEEIGDK